jgi:hypothetical protein
VKGLPSAEFEGFTVSLFRILQILSTRIISAKYGSDPMELLEDVTLPPVKVAFQKVYVSTTFIQFL